MAQLDTAAPVLVTGATGYVAGWLVQRLVAAGATVHAPVRDARNADKLKHLDAVAARGPGRIVYFEADLLNDGSYAEAMRGCRVVFHTASPFTLKVKDAQKELIDPALIGTRNVLEQARRTASVQRVVVTSSTVALHTDAIDCAAAPGGVLTEAVWNTTASLQHEPYAYSKVLAEREAWQLAEGAAFRLVTVNPSFVIGPAIGGKPTSESFTLMHRVGRGDFRLGGPRFGMGMVDVRDVADGHIAAGFQADAEGRHILCGHNTHLLEALLTLREKYGADFPLPRGAAPKWLLWTLAPLLGTTRAAVSGNVDIPWRADNSKSRTRLGLSYRPLQQSMEEMFQYMIEQGYFRKP